MLGDKRFFFTTVNTKPIFIYTKIENEKELTKYRTFGALGKAFLTSTKETPSVLLIDEIDKAGLDFPNDLLLELDEKRFYIEETTEEIRAAYPPIVIITSNDEKELPNAFLRRCIFYYVDFPSREELMKIAYARMEKPANKEKAEKLLPQNLIEQIADEFSKLRAKMKGDPNVDKVPSTSEFIDWLRVIEFFYQKGELNLENGQLPKDHHIFHEVLLKSVDDLKYRMKK